MFCFSRGQVNFDYDALGRGYKALYTQQDGFRRYISESVLVVHVVVGNSTTADHQKAAFFPVVDEFTQAILPGSIFFWV